MLKEKLALDEHSLIKLRQQAALAILANEGFSPISTYDLWASFDNKYFLHESPDIIARHTKAILTCKQFPLVLIMPHHTQGGTEVFIYMPHRDERFTITTTVLSNQRVTIQEATILTTVNGFDLDTYIILDENDHAFFDEMRTRSILDALTYHLTDNKNPPCTTQHRRSRTQAHFNLSPQITFTDDSKDKHSCLFLVTSDRSGLLASVSQIFLKESVHLHNAKIVTAGERVEDVFYISNQMGEKLTLQEQMTLREKLIQGISSN